MELVPVVKKFIEDHIEEIENGYEEYVLRKAYIQFAPSAFDQFVSILDQVIDSDLTKIKDALLLEIIDKNIIRYSTSHTLKDSISIEEFINYYILSTFLFSEDHVHNLIIKNAKRWPNNFKFDKSKSEWRVFR